MQDGARDFQTSEKPLVILTLIGTYFPGFKGGGPARSLAGLLEGLQDEFHFRIVTCDHDKGDRSRYHGLATGEWLSHTSNSRVMYLPENHLRWRGMRKVLTVSTYDVLYLNSLFSPRMSVLPLFLRRLHLIPRKAVIVAPRGELHPGALALKRTKKLTVLRVARFMRLWFEVTFQATSRAEVDHIRTWFPGARIRLASNILTRHTTAGTQVGIRAAKQQGKAAVLFLSRISRKKNLHGALEMLRTVTGQVEFRIYGPIDDESYWSECKQLIREMPPHVQVTYNGAVSPEDVAVVMAQHDVLLLPTHGENFGHVILEALGAGCPVVISDCTPWRGLEKRKAGWDLPLSAPAAFSRAMQQLVDMTEQQHESWRAAALVYARETQDRDRAVLQTRVLFREASRQRPIKQIRTPEEGLRE